MQDEQNVREVLEGAYNRIFCRDTLAGFQCDQNDRWHRFRRFLDAEAYLDAVMMLVPEGWIVDVRRYPGRQTGNATLSQWETGRTVCEYGASHPAIAVASAALKAKEQP